MSFNPWLDGNVQFRVFRISSAFVESISKSKPPRNGNALKKAAWACISSLAIRQNVVNELFVTALSLQMTPAEGFHYGQTGIIRT